MQKTNLNHLDPREQFLETKSFGIEGISCDQCVRTIEQALRSIQGVKHLDIDRATSTATVTFDHRETNLPALHDALLRHGYQATAGID